MNIEERDRLETEFIDKHTLCDVLEALTEVCFEKAEHLRTNWQDINAAKEWERAGHKIDMLAKDIEV